jgi:hypothetical protein
MRRHPSSPTQLFSATHKSTQVDADIPLLELLLVGGDLSDDLSQPMVSQRRIVFMEEGVLRL